MQEERSQPGLRFPEAIAEPGAQPQRVTGLVDDKAFELVGYGEIGEEMPEGKQQRRRGEHQRRAPRELEQREPERQSKDAFLEQRSGKEQHRDEPRILEVE